MWLLLLQFPTISRKTMTMFDCIEFEDTFLLRADPAMECYTSEWRFWAAVGGGGALLFCAGLPAIAYLIVRRLHVSNPRLVHVLTLNYRKDCWYMESLDLLRKFLVTGVVMVVLSQRREQLWFGAVVTLAFLIHHVYLQPFVDKFCNLVQFAAHVQLLLTYITALVFFDNDNDELCVPRPFQPIHR